MKIVVLDPGSTDPTWAPFGDGLSDVVMLDVPDGLDDDEIREAIRAYGLDGGPDA